MKHVIKDSLAIQAYSESKLIKSIERTLRSEGYSTASAAKNAKIVTVAVRSWIDNKTQITSLDIRRQATKALEAFDPHAALLYKKHKQIW